MRWIFLIFIALLATIVNIAIFESLSLSRAVGGIAFNLFIISLLVIWWSSYFSGGDYEKGRGLIIGHALLMLSVGIGLSALGANSAFSNNCESLISSGNSPGRIRQFASYVQSLGYCRELGFGIVLLGLYIASPSIRLFLGITKGVYRT